MKPHPENLLKEALVIDRSRLSDESANWIAEYTQVGECGLAYDTFVYEIETGQYDPSERALALIQEAALAMGIKYPAKSA
ncbi:MULTISPECIES: hypothetical protein [unclassified Variovorax]|uniref:hypothetical protein n=1 Tax=unclassified Variovorax TaxID=663243 RepID=UPI000838C58C|nr:MULTISPECIES: hypothetical protein [unclassified Variovorax]PNG59460.1 hypothetical protein CHC07_01187 [Variovorax sp. B4]PNG60749.1 hypothetical protein CHC06_00648 [Variovorax sp. B2]VTV13336.1 hypothetical protein WDL1CHR_04016 [Variovorax sp. WDL1]